MILVHDRYSPDFAGGRSFFGKATYEPSGQAPSFSIPVWSRCVIPRWLNGVYRMHRFSQPDHGKGIDFVPAEGHRFVELKLNPGEAACIDLRKLVGFDNTVTLRTEVSLRLSAFAMNRLGFTIAIGPGSVLLDTTGVPEVYLTPGESRPFSPSRLVAWSADSSFGLKVSGGLLDHYFSPAYLIAHETRGVVLDADDPKPNAMGLLMRTIRRTYSPFG